MPKSAKEAEIRIEIFTCHYCERYLDGGLFVTEVVPSYHQFWRGVLVLEIHIPKCQIVLDYSSWIAGFGDDRSPLTLSPIKGSNRRLP